MSRSAVVMVGTTEASTTPVIWFENERPACSRSPASMTASSSAVRSASVDIRHWCSSSLPRNTPSTVFVFPTFTASSTAGHPLGRRQSWHTGQAATPSSLPCLPLRYLTPSRGEEQVVDQTDVAEACSNECPGGALDRPYLLEGLVIDDRCVVQARLGRGSDLAGHDRDEGGRVALACSGRRRGLGEREEQAGRRVPLLRGQAGVTARQRETVGLTDGGTWDDLDRERQITHHPADHRELLGVLLTEVGGAATDRMEQLRDGGGHTAEVAGARGALEALAQRSPIDYDLGLSGRIHLLGARGEQDVDAPTFGHREIGLLVS